MLAIFLFVANLSLQPKYYTNTNYIYDLAGKDTIVYCATNGGVVAYDYFNETFQVLTNSDGLPTNKQNCLGLDSSGCIWAGNDLGLAVVDKNFSNIQLYPDQWLPSFMVQDICGAKDTIFIGTAGGLLIIYTKGTPQDFTDDESQTIYNTDGLPSNNVRTIAIQNGSIWVGTDEGLARFTPDSTQQFTTDSTQQFTTAKGLLSNSINKVAVIGSLIYVATNLGLNCLQGDYFDTLLTNYEIKDISYSGDSLFLAMNATNQIGIYHQGSLTIAKNGLPYLCRVLSLANVAGNIFCGLANRYTKDYYGEGIGKYDYATNYWSVTKNRCLPSNHITDITANDFGVFVSCGYRDRASESKGFGWLNSNWVWTNFSTDSMLPSNQVHRCATSPDKKVWFGFNSFPAETSSVMMFSFDPLNNEWNYIHVGYNNMENTCAVWDIKFDHHNNMYLSVAGPSDKLWVFDSALNTVYFLNPFQPGFFTEIAVDSVGRIWRTMSAAGLIMTDTKNTLFNRNDDVFHNYTTSDGLLSNYTVGCIADGIGNLYVATLDGLAMYNGGAFLNITNISNEDLFDVEIDAGGRIWILARDGLYCYDPELNTINGWKFAGLNINIDFLAVSSEIVQVQGFAFDQIRNCFWIGGETGLLRLETQFDTLPSLDNILVYPNPASKNVIRIKNIPLDSKVSIYSISGRLITKDLAVDNVFGEVVWQIPSAIGSGLYFALVKSDQGKKVCKFAIVR